MLARTPLAPVDWPAMLGLRAVERPNRGPLGKSPPWQGTAALRRTALLLLVLLITVPGVMAMLGALPNGGADPLELVILLLFTVLFAWIAAGFTSAVAGFLILLRGGDRSRIDLTVPELPVFDPAARVALLMPVCNEDVDNVVRCLRATWRSLQERPEAPLFELFLLSDSSDARIVAAEREAVLSLQREVGAAGRLHYRHRVHRIKRKSGNIADFCRRWGRNFRYFVILDADSVMSGECLGSLLRLMERHPSAGIIQTVPRAVGRRTLFGRCQQFAARVHGRLFTAGLCFWQLGDAHYWGHNAIIRSAPFMRHCQLGRLPGRGVFGGEILSHDFVEAALMRRAGYGVWIAQDLAGSYEQTPPNLLDELGRDQRWCRGNLKNLRLLFAPGISSAHRLMLVTGAMAYLSAPLWLLFLLLSTVAMARWALQVPVYFSEPGQLFPNWPQFEPATAGVLLAVTATMLFGPKLLSIALLWREGAAEYGGRGRLLLSGGIELLLSSLLAPIRMLFHSRFVLSALGGASGGWRSPSRGDASTSWLEALRGHGQHVLIGLAWTTVAVWLDPAFALWLAPVAGALVLSVPVSVWCSRAAPGQYLRGRGLLQLPEEGSPPAELREAFGARCAAAATDAEQGSLERVGATA